MVNGEEEDDNVKYWRTKYNLLSEDYERTKARTESLEDRLLEIVEESEKKESESVEKIVRLENELEESKKRVEQLEAACFRYKNQSKSLGKEDVDENKSSVEHEQIYGECPGKVSVTRTISVETAGSSVDGITRSPEFHAGEHVICEYHKLPVLARNEGFIYGFRWNIENKIHVV